jgi:hypothetical protein
MDINTIVLLRLLNKSSSFRQAIEPESIGLKTGSSLKFAKMTIIVMPYLIPNSSQLIDKLAQVFQWDGLAYSISLGTINPYFSQYL